MRIIADIHIHSRFSRATSPEMDIEGLDRWAKKKGINLLGTGDFTHPTYFSILKAKLKPLGNGLFVLKDGGSTHFMLTAEVSNIYSQGGRVRRIHNILTAPSLEVVEGINNALKRHGNLSADGRPIFGFSAKELVKIVLDVSPDCMIIPAHAWTPWFSIFGSNSGFDSIEECFGEYSKYIYAIETGLSSDPRMNWRLSSLDDITLISNSDAHSPSKLGRETNVFDCEMDYFEITRVIKDKDRKRFLYTVEFFPEEGKYHYDGHRGCQVLLSPKETKGFQGQCPICGKGVTIGVMHRVDDLADRPEDFIPEGAIPSRHLVPLEEIIAEALDVGVTSERVRNEYERLVKEKGSEFAILLDMPYGDIKRIAHPRVAEGIIRVREGRLHITPGYDGVYGKIRIFEKGEEAAPSGPRQMGLF